MNMLSLSLTLAAARIVQFLMFSSPLMQASFSMSTTFWTSRLAEKKTLFCAVSEQAAAVTIQTLTVELTQALSRTNSFTFPQFKSSAASSLQASQPQLNGSQPNPAQKHEQLWHSQGCKIKNQPQNQLQQRSPGIPWTAIEAGTLRAEDESTGERGKSHQMFRLLKTVEQQGCETML
jgi:hypothetical protein